MMTPHVTAAYHKNVIIPYYDYITLSCANTYKVTSYIPTPTAKQVKKNH